MVDNNTMYVTSAYKPNFLLERIENILVREEILVIIFSKQFFLRIVKGWDFMLKGLTFSQTTKF